jgi:hypothetical protein
VAEHSERQALVADQRPLATAEYRFFVKESFPQHVWYWHLVDGRPLTHVSTGSLASLIALVRQQGLARRGEQWFVRVSSNRPWATFAHEPFFLTFVRELQARGL